jgi:hypothetical protein
VCSRARSDLADYDASEVAGVRVHPYFSYAAGLTGAPDDVAILRLAQPLNIAGPGVRSIALAAAGAVPLQGAQVVEGVSVARCGGMSGPP